MSADESTPSVQGTEPIVEIIEPLECSAEFHGTITCIIFLVHNKQIAPVMAAKILAELYRLDTGRIVGPEHIRSLIGHEGANKYLERLVERKKRIDRTKEEVIMSEQYLSAVFNIANTPVAAPRKLQEPEDNVVAENLTAPTPETESVAPTTDRFEALD